jgi:hypothetical protein
MLFTFSQCKKHKNTEAQLPPITTIGAMTFGCKINEKVFVPMDGRGKPGLYVQYVNVGTGPGGGWYLNIPAVDWNTVSIPAVSITTDSLLVTEGGTYTFKKVKGYAMAFYATGSDYFDKLDNDNGSLHIIKFDVVNRILSGTFYFIGTNRATGEKVNITEGRFDIRY